MAVRDGRAVAAAAATAASAATAPLPLHSSHPAPCCSRRQPPGSWDRFMAAI